MPLISLHDRETIATLLRHDPALHAYQLGDLDDFYYPFTTWYALDGALALIYHSGGYPVLLSFGPPSPLITELLPLLPRHFDAHLSPGAIDPLAASFDITNRGLHLKMALPTPDPADAALAAAALTAKGAVLTDADLPEILALYAAAYPGNWFDPRMLATGQYIGIHHDGELAAIAGVHVYSPAYKVAALGNVTTHPAHRGHGFASAAVAQLCQQLSSTVDTITLNVKADNATAIGLYTRLGFTITADYYEYSLSARH
jgi:ribosomal protein S18 acetylase RimI-like enzyme